jgi:hypothetical protein
MTAPSPEQTSRACRDLNESQLTLLSLLTQTSQTALMGIRSLCGLSCLSLHLHHLSFHTNGIRKKRWKPDLLCEREIGTQNRSSRRSKGPLAVHLHKKRGAIAIHRKLIYPANSASKSRAVARSLGQSPSAILSWTGLRREIASAFLS